MKRQRLVYISFLSILLISSILFFIQLGREAYWDYDEASYAHVTDQLSTSGDFLTMHYGGEQWIDKPPFYFWFAYGSRLLFGNNEFATRFPSAVGAVMVIALVWLIVYKEIKNIWMPFVTASILITTGAFLEVGRQARLDTLVTAAILGSWFFYIKGKEKSIYYVGIGVCIGIGLMIKNVVGLLGFIPIIIDSFFLHNWSWLKNNLLWSGIIVGLFIALPWPLYEIHVVGGEFVSRYIGTHIIERFSTNIFHNDASVQGYINYLYRFAMPWVLFFVTSLWILFKSKIPKKEKELYVTSTLTAISIFIFFCIAQTKAVTYLTPIYPFIAISLGTYFYTIIQKKYNFLFLLLPFIIPIAINAGFHKDAYFAFDRDIAEEEKVVGTLLKHSSFPIYFKEASYWETIRVYSGHSRLDTDKDKKPPYYLVVQKQNSSNLPMKGELIYCGKLISVYLVTE